MFHTKKGYTFGIFKNENKTLNHMKNLSLKLDDTIYQETESVLDEIKIPRNRYINEALTYYNRLQRNKILAEKLRSESLMVQEESMNILAEFENIEYNADQTI